MSKVNELLNQRLKKGEGSSKMAAMARQSADGNLSSFSGLFVTAELSDQEKIKLEEILKAHVVHPETVDSDLATLIAITSEIKAINNQAALLHGERVKKVHTILTRYRDGAFTAWMMAAYGNRQTPYNLMQYYEFCEVMPKTLRFQIEAMPRQAIYTLATREGPLNKKKEIVEDYKGETKSELLIKIRGAFPLDEEDGRSQDVGEATVQALKRLHRALKQKSRPFSRTQKEAARLLLADIQALIEGPRGS